MYYCTHDGMIGVLVFVIAVALMHAMYLESVLPLPA
jgi:hypothetical protein